MYRKKKPQIKCTAKTLKKLEIEHVYDCIVPNLVGLHRSSQIIFNYNVYTGRPKINGTRPINCGTSKFADLPAGVLFFATGELAKFLIKKISP